MRSVSPPRAKEAGTSFGRIEQAHTQRVIREWWLVDELEKQVEELEIQLKAELKMHADAQRQKHARREPYLDS